MGEIFLTSALAGGEWSVSRPGRFTSGKEPLLPIDRRLGGPQNQSGRYGEVKNLPYRDSNYNPSVIQTRSLLLY
jgi:hypothetical protein